MTASRQNAARRGWIKPYEFWHPRLFELPFYVYLAFQCLRYRLPLRGLAKANYALYHGEIGIGSKFDSQMKFDQQLFLPTALLEADWNREEKVAFVTRFVEEHGYPLILKPDVGLVGKGILKLHDDSEARARISQLSGSYLVQQFTPKDCEWGIFYCRSKGTAEISGINRKHFPAIVGNGCDSIQVLAENHERFTAHWQTFLQYHDTSRIPDEGETLTLSFIGSHTMGCKFTDDIEILTDDLQRAVFALFENQPGYNFGRIDVKAASEAALQRGEFVVIEVNGISSLPTHMFDPTYNVIDAYRIFFEHGKRLAAIADEHREQEMSLLPHRDILKKVIASQSLLDKVHQELIVQPTGESHDRV